jgi:hypothetical protein
MKLDFLNIFLVRFVQIIVMGFFVFAVLVYFGLMLLLPLSIFSNVVHLVLYFSNGVFATLVGAAVIFGLARIGHSVPHFFGTILTTGLKLVDMGVLQTKRFNEMVEEMRPQGAAPPAA